MNYLHINLVYIHVKHIDFRHFNVQPYLYFMFNPKSVNHHQTPLQKVLSYWTKSMSSFDFDFAKPSKN